MSLRHNAADVIQSLNDYFNNEPIVHFNSDCTTNYSSLTGAVSGPSEPTEVMVEVDSSIADIPQNGEGVSVLNAIWWVRFLLGIHLEVAEDINNGQLEPPPEGDRDQFEVLNNEGRDRDHQFDCEVLDNEYLCGCTISFNSCKSHLVGFHSIPKDEKVCCPWFKCGRSSHRKNLVRHIRTRHLGFKRLPGAPFKILVREGL